jgi:RNA polymerase sigma-70 factor, ECF subfamily
MLNVMPINSRPDPDIELIHSMAAGDTTALDTLYARHGRAILSYLRAYLNNPQVAEEVLQDVMLAVWENAGRFRGESKVRTWILVIARNRALNTRRKLMPTIVPLDENMDVHETGPLEKIELKSQQQMMRQAINRLPEQHKEILVLVFYHQLSNLEVAEVLGINPGTVKSRLHRAKEALRRVLQLMGENSNA